MTTTAEQWRTMVKELFENNYMAKQNKVMAKELIEEDDVFVTHHT